MLLGRKRETKPVGTIVEQGYFVRCGLLCCTCDLRSPQVLVLGKRQCLCCIDAASFLFEEGYVAGPICAVYDCQCMPNVGSCKPPIKGAAVAPGGAPPVEMMGALMSVVCSHGERRPS